MDLNLAKVLAQLLLLLRRDVLVAEEDDAALGDQQRQLVALHVGQILELQAFDLSADVRGQMRHARRRPEQVLLAPVCPRARVHVRPLLGPDLVHVLDVQRPRRPVWVPMRQVDAGLGEPLDRRRREPERVLGRWRRKVDDSRIDRARRHVGDSAGSCLYEAKACSRPWQGGQEGVHIQEIGEGVWREEQHRNLGITNTEGADGRKTHKTKAGYQWWNMQPASRLDRLDPLSSESAAGQRASGARADPGER